MFVLLEVMCSKVHVIENFYLRKAKCLKDYLLEYQYTLCDYTIHNNTC